MGKGLSVLSEGVESAKDGDSLDFTAGDVSLPAVVELGCAGRAVAGHQLGVLELAPVLHEVGNTSAAKWGPDQVAAKSPVKRRKQTTYLDRPSRSQKSEIVGIAEGVFSVPQFEIEEVLAILNDVLEGVERNVAQVYAAQLN